MTQKEIMILKSELNNALAHIQIIATWAAVGVTYDGIEPKCCESVAKWCKEIERTFLRLQEVAGF